MNETATIQTQAEHYRDLLLRRDHLYRDAGVYQVMYTAEFGDLIVENFELKVACIKEKKTINYCRRRMNRGLPIDVEHMQDEIEKEMMLYRQQMKEISSEYDNALEAHTASQYEYNQSKRIYRRLAKVLHPDIFPDIRNQPDLQQLWAEIFEAYNRCDVERLEDYEVIVRIKLESWGEDGFALACNDLGWRINRVEMQINEILTTEPYTYCELLHDDAKKAAHRESLQEEHDEYETRLAELRNTLEELLHQEGTRFLWNMS